MKILEHVFHLTEQGTTVRRELLGALTSFFLGGIYSVCHPQLSVSDRHGLYQRAVSHLSVLRLGLFSLRCP